jgi:cation diffusion facilitator CzcD-associated flavoprotein CzcO
MDVETTEVLIVGTGFAGLGTAIQLRKAGVEDFIILERDDGIGGTWWANHYPGAACDVESHLYSFSFEPNPEWSYMFARQAEIQRYLEGCADKHGLRDRIRLKSEVASARWDEARARWTVETKDGRRFEARAIVSGAGGLSRPAVPSIPGLEEFRGHTFHSARWDESFDLAGKRVGVIGTGASAIQIVPQIAKKAAKLDVFQRTPPWVIPHPDRPIAAWERMLFRTVPATQKLARFGIYLNREFVKGSGFLFAPGVLKIGTRIALRHLREQVADPVLREKLTPHYAFGCKRVLLSNEYYPALQKPNVELVTDAIERVTPTGVQTKDGRLHELDALVLATGFQVADVGAPFEVRGRADRSLDDAWRDTAEAYLGTTVPGFPNLFIIMGPNVGLGHNSMVYMIESQITYVLGALERMRSKKIDAVDVRPEVARKYNDELQARLAKTVWAGGCKSWYQNKAGKVVALWPGPTYEFRARTKRFDAESYEELVARDERGTESQALRSGSGSFSIA